MVKEASPPPVKTRPPPRGDDLSALLSQVDNKANVAEWLDDTIVTEVGGSSPCETQLLE